jgi:hypothetical protein
VYCPQHVVAAKYEDFTVKRIFILLLTAIAIVWGSVATAAPITIGSSTAFTASAYAGQFFDHASWDGSNCNVGNYLTAVTGCPQSNFYNGSPNALLPFLGVGQTEFLFGNALNSSVLLTGVSAHLDEFGWFAAGTNDYHPLFDNQDPLNTSASFAPGGDYGLYFLDTATNVRWRTDTLGDAQSHFALFSAGNGTYYLGMEDLRGPLGSTDYDYNDAVVRMETHPVPEPGGLSLFGIGLLALGSKLRKWKKA